ncbi:MAG TPA: glycosyltransferase family 2 protein [Candidatus Fournierella merdigallinarum]|nr:glycosyltransferase family 2 protein [Candidatus Fournierella merdigallinarum]
MKILVIIPCYNESQNIARVVRRLKEACPEADYVVVNDCSTDSSVEILQAEGCNYLDLPINLGIGGGVQCGYQYAVEQGYDVTVQMDGDGQHDPAFLRAVIAPVAAGELDMCIGSRFITKEGFQTSFMRRVGIRFLSALLRLLAGCKVRDVTSGYRACGRALTARFAQQYAQDYPEPEAILRAVCEGYKVGEVPVVMAERQGGVSSINALKSVYYMIKVSLSLVILRLSFTRPGGETR